MQSLLECVDQHGLLSGFGPRLIGAGLVFLGAFGAAPAAAQVTRPVQLIVPFSTGGATDSVARVIAPRLTDLMKRPVIVDNKPGATGVIGTQLVARAAPDGATILFGTSSSMASSAAILPNLPYNVINDFVAVGMVATTDNVLVIHPSVPVRSVQEFIAYAKANPRKIAYGTSGIGSTYHLGAELFATKTGTALTHVPYKGAGPATQDLIAGHIQMMMEAVYSAGPNVKAGKVRALGITSLKRNPRLPDVPTLAEQGVTGCEFSQWIALFLPANASKAAVDKLNADLNRVLGDTEVQERIAKIGMEVAPGKPEELAATLRADLARWTKVAREADIKSE